MAFRTGFAEFDCLFRIWNLAAQSWATLTAWPRNSYVCRYLSNVLIETPSGGRHKRESHPLYEGSQAFRSRGLLRLDGGQLFSDDPADIGFGHHAASALCSGARRFAAPAASSSSVVTPARDRLAHHSAGMLFRRRQKRTREALTPEAEPSAATTA